MRGDGMTEPAEVRRGGRRGDRPCPHGLPGGDDAVPAPPQKRGHDEVARWVEDVLLTTCRLWVAVRDTEVVGYAALGGDVLEHLYLRPEARFQGIGTLLLDEVRRHSPGGLSLHVFERNAGARAFYQRHGFTVVGTSDGSRNMENLPDLTLRWTPER